MKTPDSGVLRTTEGAKLKKRFSKFLSSSDNQFGFKKSLSCSHAVYSTRLIVDSFVKAGKTANLCSIDLSKAFDKVNHYIS